jgi:hypothetical protein
MIGVSSLQRLKKSVFTQTIFTVIIFAFSFSPLFQIFSYPAVAEAAINKQINYQGKLTTSAGVAVPDGTYNMEFKIYTGATGGSTLWTETNTGSNRVQVTGGLFSIMLGSTTPLDGVDFNQTLYLGVNIGGTAVTPVWDGEMSPRKILGAVPAAFVSDTVDGVSSEQFLRNDAANATSTASTWLSFTNSGVGDIAQFIGQSSLNVMTLKSDGRVGIGTSSPYAKLSVAGAVVGEYFTATSTSATSTLPKLSVTSLGLASDYVTDITGSNLTITSGSLGVSATPSFTTVTASGAITGSSLVSSSGGISATFATANNYSGGLTVNKRGTTGDANAAVVSGSEIGYHYFRAWDGAAYGNAGLIITYASEDWTSTNHGAYMSFRVTPSGGTTQTEALRLVDSGQAYAPVSLRIASLTGPLQAVSGVVSATSSISVSYGGTGVTTAPSYGQVLLGNSSGGYTLTATSSLGFASATQIGSGLAGQFPYYAANGTDLTATSTLFLSAAGNIGLGTTSPQSLFYLSKASSPDITIHSTGANQFEGGRIRFIETSNTYQGGYIHYDGSSNILNIGVHQNADATVGNDTDAISIARISGNVGIGTTSPTSKLTVAGDIELTAAQRAAFVTSSDSAFIYRTTTSVSGSYPFNSVGNLVFQARTSSGGRDIVFATGNGTPVSSMIVTSAGNVGIGTTSPAQKLDVAGNAWIRSTTPGASNKLYLGNFSDVYTTPFAYIETDDVTGDKFSIYTARWGYDTSFKSGGQPGDWTYAQFNGIRSGTASDYSRFAVFDAIATTTKIFQAASDTHSFFNTGKNVGINTTSPTASLHISSTTPSLDLFKITAGSNTVVVNSSGNLGIGTTTPSRKLQVSVDNGASGQFLFTGSSNPLNQFYGGYDTTNNIGFIQAQTSGSSYRTMALNPYGGNVGIGTTSASILLNLASAGTPIIQIDTTDTTATGRIRFTENSATKGQIQFVNSAFATADRQNAFEIRNEAAGPLIVYTNSSERLRVLSGGNVGIGTSTPASKLSLALADANAMTIDRPGIGLWNVVLGTTAGNNAPGHTLQFRAPTAGNLSVGNSTNGAAKIWFDGETGNSYFGGNLGVGTTSAGAKIHSLATTEQLRLGYNASTYASFAVSSSGELTITPTNSATTTFANDIAARNLQISSTGGVRGVYRDSDSFNLDMLGGTTTDSGARISISGGIRGGASSPYNGKMEFWTGSTYVANQASLIGDYVFNSQWAGSSATLMTIKSNSGNVGIGTTSPWQKLSVTGNLSVTGAFYDSIASAGTNGMVLQTTGSGTRWVATSSLGFASATQIGSGTTGQFPYYAANGTDLTATSTLFLSTGGNIGIGTTNPLAKLQIGGYAIATTGWYNDTSTQSGMNTPGSGTLSFRAGGTDNRMVISSAGNVGIGTTTPTSLLHVGPGGTAATDVNFAIDSGSGSGAEPQLRFLKNSLLKGAVYIKDGTEALTFYNNGSDRMVIDTAGNVGIGTTTPLAKLDVLGTGHVSSTFDIGPGTNALQNGRSMYFTYGSTFGSIQAANWGTGYENLALNPTGGNVGIGTTTPRANLEVKNKLIVQGTSNNYGFTIDPDNGSGPMLQLGTYANPSAYMQIGAWAGVNNFYTITRDFKIYSSTDTTGFNFIAASGNVGIGTSSPYAKLGVAGQIVANNIWATSTSATNYFGGNVGVGTTSPNTPLSIFAANATQMRISYDANNTSTIGVNSSGYLNLTPSGGRVVINTTYLDTQASTILLGSGGFGGAGDIVFRNTGGANGTISPVFKIKDSTAALQEGLRFNPTWIDSTPGTMIVQNAVSSLGTTIFDMTAGEDGSSYVNFAGNVGIGTSTPWKTLSVSGDMSLTGAFFDGAASAGTNGMVLQTTGSGTQWVATSSLGFASATQIGSGTTGQFPYYAANGTDLTATSTLFLASDGKLGVGTTSPRNQFTIDGVSPVFGVYASSNGRGLTLDPASGAFDSINSALSLNRFTGNAVAVGYSSASHFRVGQMVESGTFGATALLYVGNTETNTVGLVIDKPSGGTADLFNIRSATTTTAGDILTVKASGNVGIGTTTPDTLLNVFGGGRFSKTDATIGFSIDRVNSGANGSTRFAINSTHSQIGAAGALQFHVNNTADIGSVMGGTLAMTITTGANVGIGTTTPYAKLAVDSDTSSNQTLRLTNTGLAGQLLLEDKDQASASTPFYYLQSSAGKLAIGSANRNTSTNLSTGSSDLMTFTTSGVGFGTSTPGAEVDVYGNSATVSVGMRLVNDNTTSGATIRQMFGVFNGNSGLLIDQSSNSTGPSWSSGSYDAFIRTRQANSKLHLAGYSGASDLPSMTIDASGNVGIGTTSPWQKLSVSGSLSVTGAIYDSAASAGTNGMVLQTTGSGTQWVATSSLGFASASQIGSGTTGQLPYYAANGSTLTATSTLYIGLDSEVGIGTQSPSGKLHVVGSSDSALTAFFQRTSTAIQNSAIVGIHSSSTATSVLAREPEMKLRNMDSTVGNYTSILNYNSSAVVNGGIDFLNVDHGYKGAIRFVTRTSQGNYGERMRIDENGNVGIGTNSPTALLSISSTTPSLDLFKVTAGSNTVVINSSGNVGIGTSTPTRALDVYSTANGYAAQITNGFGGSSAGGLLIKTSDGNGVASAFQIDSYQMSSWFTVKNPGGNGVVGIATSTPSARFAITGGGTGTGRAFAIANSSNAEKFTILDNGNVGVGTTSPWKTLSVAGSMSLTGAFFDGSASAGTNGMVLQTTGSATQWVATSSLGFASATQIGSGTAGQFPYYAAAGSDLSATSTLFLSTGGNVGIGYTSPQQKLHVRGGAIASGGGNTEGALVLYPANTANNWFNIRNADAGGSEGLRFGKGAYPSTTDLMTLTPAGNLGIGTTTPTKALSVTGSAYVSGLLSVGTSENTSAYVSITTAAANTAAFRYTDGTNYTINGGYSANGVGYLGGLSGTAFALHANASEVMRLTTGGNVGIGTTTPGAKLQAVSTTEQLRLGYDGQNYSTFTVNSDSDLTISNSSATGDISINPNAVLNLGTSLTDNILMGRTDIGGFYTAISSQGGETMRVANGSVGIGTTSPYARLSVSGSTATTTMALRPASGQTANILDIYSTSGTLSSVINSAGNVGIGTTNPTRKLEIYGSSAGSTIAGLKLKNEGGSVDTAVAIDFDFFSTDSVGARISGVRTNAGNFQSALAFYTNTGSSGSTITEKMRITGDGNVGIGTTSPGTTLTVQGAGVGVINMGQMSGSTQFSGIAFSQNTSSVVTSANYSLLGEGTNTYLNRPTGGSIFFRQNNTNEMVLSSGGNLGIATTTPGAKLGVTGNALFTGNVFSFGGYSLRSSDGFATGYGNTWSVDSTNYNSVLQGTMAGGSDYWKLSGTATGDAGVFEIASGDNGTEPITFVQYNGLTGTERMRISSTGNVGVGTSTPWAKLAVNGNAGQTGPIFAVATTSSAFATSTAFLIDSNGNVGIGTNNPSSSLYVVGNRVQLVNAGNSGEGQLHFSSTASDTYLTGNNTLGFTFYTNSSEKFKIADDGTIGIATSTPWGKLSITNTGTIPSFVVEDATSPDSTPFIIDATGNVGIGTSSPDQKLVVAGSQKLTNLATGSGIFGENASANQIFTFTRQDTITTGDLSVSAYGGIGLTGGRTSNNAAASGYGLYVNSSNNVGIGTTSPAYKAVIAGNSTGVFGDSAGQLAIIGSTDGNQRLKLGYQTDADYGFIEAVKVGSNNMPFVINPRGGNVGIGTTSPFAKLSVAGTIVGANFIGTTTATSTFGGGIDLASGCFAIAGTCLTSGGSSQWTDITGGINYSGGNVGIATSTPSGKFAVNGNTYIAGTLTATSSITVDTSYNNSDANLYLKSANAGWATLTFRDTTGNRASIYATNSSLLTFNTGSSLTTRMVINSSGNVGIGETAPGSKLSVSGGATIGATYDTLVAPTNGLLVEGNVGIGTSTPLHKLSIVQDNSTVSLANGAGQLSIAGATNPTKRLNIGLNTTGNYAWIQAGQEGSAYYDLALNPLLGNVGVGTSTPSANLEVAGTFSVNGVSSGANTQIQLKNGSTDFALISSMGALGGASGGLLNYIYGNNNYEVYTNGVSRFTVDGSGNVGIGTSSPTEKLSIKLGSDSDMVSIARSSSSGRAQIALLTESGSEMWRFGAPAAGSDTFHFYNGANRLSINSDGNVGVGSSSPSTLFAVSGTSTLQHVLPGGTIANNLSQYDLGASSQRWNSVWAGTLNLGTSTWSLSQQNGNRLSIFDAASSGGSERFSILNGGNVGIGTNAPSAKLAVAGDVSVTGDFTIATTSAASTTPTFQSDPGSVDTRNNHNGTVGFTFQVSQNMVIYELGRHYISGNSQDHVVKLWVSTDQSTPLASGTVLASSPSDANGFKYVSITPVTLTPGNTYALAVDETSGGDSWKEDWNPSGVMSALLTNLASAYSASSGAYPATGNSSNEIFGAPVMKYSDTVYNANVLYASMSTKKVGIGTISPQRALHVYTLDDVAPVRFQDASGYCEINPTSTSWSCTSDARLKKDIVTISSTTTLDAVMKLRPVTFAWNKDKAGAEKRYGLIAQEVEQIFPEFVNTDEKGFKSVAYGSLTPMLISAIQEQQKKIDELSVLFQGLDEVMNATSTSPKTQGFIAKIFSSFGAKISQGSFFVQNIFADTITIGSPTKQSMISIYDKNGKEGCMLVDDVTSGQVKVLQMPCSQVASTTTMTVLPAVDQITTQTGSNTSSTVITPTASTTPSTTSTTTPATSTTTPVTSSTSSTTPSTTQPPATTTTPPPQVTPATETTPAVTTEVTIEDVPAVSSAPESTATGATTAPLPSTVVSGSEPE